MTPLGGSKRILRRASAAGGLSWKVAWSPDGELLAYVDDKADEPSGVFLMSASGSSVRRLTTAPPNTADGYPSFSPDGRQIAFVRGRTVYKNDIYVVPVSGGEPRRLTFLDTGVFSPLWTPDGRKIIFSLGGLIANLNDISASDGSHSITGLYAVPVSGGRPERLSLPQMNVSDPSFPAPATRSPTRDTSLTCPFGSCRSKMPAAPRSSLLPPLPWTAIPSFRQTAAESPLPRYGTAAWLSGLVMQMVAT